LEEGPFGGVILIQEKWEQNLKGYQAKKEGAKKPKRKTEETKHPRGLFQEG